MPWLFSIFMITPCNKGQNHLKNCGDKAYMDSIMFWSIQSTMEMILVTLTSTEM